MMSVFGFVGFEGCSLLPFKCKFASASTRTYTHKTCVSFGDTKPAVASFVVRDAYRVCGYPYLFLCVVYSAGLGMERRRVEFLFGANYSNSIHCILRLLQTLPALAKISCFSPFCGWLIKWNRRLNEAKLPPLAGYVTDEMSLTEPIYHVQYC